MAFTPQQPYSGGGAPNRPAPQVVNNRTPKFNVAQNIQAAGQVQQTAASTRQTNAVAEGQELKNEQIQMETDNLSEMRALQEEAVTYAGDPQYAPQLQQVNRQLSAKRAMIATMRGDFANADKYSSMSQMNDKELELAEQALLASTVPGLTALQAANYSDPDFIGAYDFAISMEHPDGIPDGIDEDKANLFVRKLSAMAETNPAVHNFKMNQARERRAYRDTIALGIRQGKVKTAQIQAQLESDRLKEQGQNSRLIYKERQHWLRHKDTLALNEREFQHKLASKVDEMKLEYEKHGLNILDSETRRMTASFNMVAEQKKIGIMERNADTGAVTAKASMLTSMATALAAANGPYAGIASDDQREEYNQSFLNSFSTMLPQLTLSAQAKGEPTPEQELTSIVAATPLSLGHSTAQAGALGMLLHAKGHSDQAVSRIAASPNSMRIVSMLNKYKGSADPISEAMSEVSGWADSEAKSVFQKALGDPQLSAALLDGARVIGDFHKE